MFGKPEWFRPKKFGWGLVPITWQGWVYSLLWSLLIAGPFLAFLFVPQAFSQDPKWPEGVIWLFVAILLLTWDVREILRQIRRKEAANLFYIGDDDPSGGQLETQNYNLHLRD